MNRIVLLNEIKNMIEHNISCYSENYSMLTPKEIYKEEWNQEQEKLEIINEMIEEEKSNEFRLYTSIYNLNHNREERINHDLAYLEDRKNGISCFLVLREKENIPEYELVFNIHKKSNFDNEYENIYSKDINKESFKDRQTLKKEMQDGLEIFKMFIEEDKQKNKYFNKFYEEEELE